VLLGGVSIFGGRGRLVGVVLALFLIGALRNSLGLADVGAEKQSIVIGTLLILSVIGTNALTGLQDRLARRQRMRAAPVTGSPSQTEGGGGS
jgi:rhamnose transport system permease protein